MSESDRTNNTRIVLLLLGTILVAWYFFRNYEIDGLDQVDIRTKNALTSVPVSDDAERETMAVTEVVGHVDSQPYSRRLRIASWMLAGFGTEKMAKPHVMDLACRVIRDCDLIAVQGLRAANRDLPARLVEHLNRSGRKYDYLLAPPVLKKTARSPGSESMAFFFDTETIVTDRSQFYSLSDPDDLFLNDPIVGWFQAVGPPTQTAWTFSVINVQVDMARARHEVAALARAMAAVQADGRQEDDVLLAGLFQADDAYLVPSVGKSTVSAVVQATPTDIFSQHQTSNILFRNASTTEFLGSGGVIDFLRVYNLNSAEAEEITPHLPVYGVFSGIEGESH